jgi:hypothetical protein
MPDQRLQTRETLPTGYQFGDARPVLCHFCRRDIATEAKLSLRGDKHGLGAWNARTARSCHIRTCELPTI